MATEKSELNNLKKALLNEQGRLNLAFWKFSFRRKFRGEYEDLEKVAFWKKVDENYPPAFQSASEFYSISKLLNL
jgi:hypothetical protein